MATGCELILTERLRQMHEEGWTPEHDDTHTAGQLADAAICYAANVGQPSGTFKKGQRRGLTSVFSLDYNAEEVGFPMVWPWGDREFHPSPDDRVRELVKAGALIAAEIDRIQRIAAIENEVTADGHVRDEAAREAEVMEGGGE